MLKKLLLSLSLLLALVLVMGGVFLLVPKVLFVLPEGPEQYVERFSRPSILGKGYIALSVPSGEESKYAVLKPKVVVYPPLSEPVEGNWTSVQYGNVKSRADVVVTLDRERMWDDALAELEGKAVAILYSSTDSLSATLASRLLEKHPNAVPVTYEGRVGATNRDEVVFSLDTFYAVLVLDPSSSASAYRATKSRVVMDFRDAAAAVTKDRVLSVGPDWNKVIEAALRGESKVSPDYTLTVTKK